MEDYEDDEDVNFADDSTLDEKRQLRKNYRELMADLEDEKQEHVKAHSETLIERIKQANKLFNQVRSTQEAALDAKLMSRAAEMGIERIQKISLAGKTFDVDSFLDRVRFVGGCEDTLPSQQSIQLDWVRIGEMASACSKRAPTIGFMLGPLAVEPKARKERKGTIQRLSKDSSTLTRPQELKESDVLAQENETTKSVKELRRILRRQGEMCLFNFFVNPESFSQTVENLFHVSFLVRDGHVYITEDEGGQPVIGLVDQSAESEHSSGGAKKQFVFELTYDLWKDLIELYDIRESVIPTRAQQPQPQKK